jgi:hypothetical protein
MSNCGQAAIGYGVNKTGKLAVRVSQKKKGLPVGETPKGFNAKQNGPKGTNSAQIANLSM